MKAKTKRVSQKLWRSIYSFIMESNPDAYGLLPSLQELHKRFPSTKDKLTTVIEVKEFLQQCNKENPHWKEDYDFPDKHEECFECPYRDDSDADVGYNHCTRFDRILSTQSMKQIPVRHFECYEEERYLKFLLEKIEQSKQGE